MCPLFLDIRRGTLRISRIPARSLFELGKKPLILAKQSNSGNIAAPLTVFCAWSEIYIALSHVECSNTARCSRAAMFAHSHTLFLKCM